MIRLTTLLLCLLSTACASSGYSVAKNEPIEIAFYQAGQRHFTLVNEAHTNRLELYSKISNNASTKVATDEIMDTLLDYFDEQGFFELATSGGTHESSEGRALVFQGRGGTLNLSANSSSSQAQLKAFNSCGKAFIDVWNNIFAPQSVRNTQGESVFGEQKRPR